MDTNIFFFFYLDTKPKRVVKRDHHQYYGGDDFGRGYDPFRLVPTEHYSEKTPAPFEVEIDSNALVCIKCSYRSVICYSQSLASW